MVAIIHRFFWSPSSIGCYGRHHPSVVMDAIIHRLLWSPSSIICYGRHHPSVVMVAIIDHNNRWMMATITTDGRWRP
jgi:hypothetical protein